ncbi:hypothetical protein NG895_03130 [Aeoliella sp. ICT_H6.2]|uniref:Lipoprotein n=1 Tax=Aeoliella straminimaris TaxID=2954799 RepID=A0A9X2F794_9BACT|nr:hypothetical protein [Aeoliella straminimaris]MCO6042892.1 hypothetical protein [Aeoliella straminimaris]
MRCLLSLPVVLGLSVCGCWRESGISAHPEIATGQIERDTKDILPSSGGDEPYNEGEIEVLESNYSGDQATIVLSAGSINVGNLAPADIEGLTPEIRPKVAHVDSIPYRLQLEYEWVRGEWRLLRLDNLTFEDR